MRDSDKEEQHLGHVFIGFTLYRKQPLPALPPKHMDDRVKQIRPKKKKEREKQQKRRSTTATVETNDKHLMSGCTTAQKAKELDTARRRKTPTSTSVNHQIA